MPSAMPMRAARWPGRCTRTSDCSSRTHWFRRAFMAAPRLVGDRAAVGTDRPCRGTEALDEIHTAGAPQDADLREHFRAPRFASDDARTGDAAIAAHAGRGIDQM